MIEGEDIAVPEWVTGYDEHQRPIPVAHPVYDPAEDDGGDDLVFSRADLAQALKGFISMAAETGGTPLRIGQNLLITNYKLGCSKWKTDRELAKFMGVTPGRLSQLIKQLPPPFAALARLNRRQKPPDS
jgi:hypothetical protein